MSGHPGVPLAAVRAFEEHGEGNPSSTADAVIDLLMRGLIRRNAARSDAVRRLAVSMLECDPRLPELLHNVAPADASPSPRDVAGSSASTVSAASTAPESLDLKVAQRRASEAFALAWARSEVCVGAAPRLSELARVLSGSAARAMIKFGLRCDVPAARAPSALARLVSCGLVFGEEAAHASACAGLFGRQPRVSGGSRAGVAADSLGSARLATWAFASPPGYAHGPVAVLAGSGGGGHGFGCGAFAGPGFPRPAGGVVWPPRWERRQRAVTASSGDGSLPADLDLRSSMSTPEVMAGEGMPETDGQGGMMGGRPRATSDASTTSAGPDVTEPGAEAGGMAQGAGGTAPGGSNGAGGVIA